MATPHAPWVLLIFFSFSHSFFSPPIFFFFLFPFALTTYLVIKVLHLIIFGIGTGASVRPCRKEKEKQGDNEERRSKGSSHGNRRGKSLKGFFCSPFPFLFSISLSFSFFFLLVSSLFLHLPFPLLARCLFFSFYLPSFLFLLPFTLSFKLLLHLVCTSETRVHTYHGISCSFLFN